MYQIIKAGTRYNENIQPVETINTEVPEAEAKRVVAMPETERTYPDKLIIILCLKTQTMIHTNKPPLPAGLKGCGIPYPVIDIIYSFIFVK